MDEAALAEGYYDAIDSGAYDALRDLLAPEFEHVRPDRTFTGRETFVSFMRDGRPRTDTRHAIDGVYDGAEGVAVRGRLVADDDPLFAFVDVFETTERIERIRTYVD